MRSIRLPLLGAAVAACVLAGTALGVGPWPGLAPVVSDPGANLRYAAQTARGQTTIRVLRGDRTVAIRTVSGAFGIPAVTSIGAAGGLSPDGRLLVLAEPPTYKGLRDHSTFLVLKTIPLAELTRIRLDGEFGFDAISPNRRFLYLVQHVSSADLIRYVVRAYDLRTKRLLPGAIVDKREAGEVMRGYPVSRAESAQGAWVYTLYQRPNQRTPPFVHALNTVARTAFCIDLRTWPAELEVWDARLKLAADGRQLLVRALGRTIAEIDTETLEVEQT